MGRSMPRHLSALAAALMLLPAMLWAASASAQENLPWQRGGDPRYQQPDDAYRPDPRYSDPRYDDPRQQGSVRPYEPTPPRYGAQNQPQDQAYRPPRQGDAYSPRGGDPYNSQSGGSYNGPGNAPYYGPNQSSGYNQPSSGRYGQPYTPNDESQDYDRRYDPRPYNSEEPGQGYSSNEITQAGHRFFGTISKGMASVIEYAFQQQGRPNGYILGQDAGGAFVAGLRYGEGTLYTRDAGTHRVYWQGPSIGWDAGAAGSKVMVLIYNLRDPEEIYQRFGGVDGSAYVVGGVGLTFQKSGDVVAAPIRAGVGLRLGANIGYLKYTRTPTWNPF
jgi:hypothetical protein